MKKQTVSIKEYLDLQAHSSDTVKELNLAKNEIARLEAEVASLREAQRWIPVSDRLPERKSGKNTNFVLVRARATDENGDPCGPWCVSNAIYSRGKWFHTFYSASAEITHWTQARELPEDE